MYIQWSGNSNVGYLWMGDNTNCIHSYRKAYSGSSALAGELRKFAHMAEQNALGVVTKYINTHRNLIADMGTRNQVFLASVYHDIFSDRPGSLWCDEYAAKTLLLPFRVPPPSPPLGYEYVA